MHGLGRLHRLAQRRIVRRHLAPAQQRHALALDLLGPDVADHLSPIRIARHEERADGVFAGLGQGETEPLRLLGEELVRDLDQDAGAVAGARVGADRAAMLEIAQDGEGILDQLVRGAALDVGNEADAAGILFERGIVKSLRRRQPGVGAVGKARRGAFAARSSAPALACAHVCRAHFRPRVSPPPKHRRTRRLGAPSASAAPKGVAASRAPLVIGGLLATAARRKRVAACVKWLGDAVGRAYHPPM